MATLQGDAGFGAALDEDLKKQEEEELKRQQEEEEKEEDDDDSKQKAYNEKVQEVMNDNLDIMRDIVFRIREDPDFASNIYADCPRLQELLDKNPDLRPIFEDPKLVRINFEKVYRDNGGVLPEDEEAEPGPLRRTINKAMAMYTRVKESKLMKAFKLFKAIQKIAGFLSPSKGLGAIKGCFKSCFNPEDLEEAEAEGNPVNAETKAQLNRAADHMEDPEVQANMQEMLDNPESMEDTIDNDPALRQLQEDNPLCGEMMKDPETMKVLTNPDNLRALGDAPDLIEQDFSAPDFSPPDAGMDMEVPEMEAPEMEAPEIEGEMEGEMEGEVDGEMEEEEEEGGLMDQIQEQKDMNDEEMDAGGEAEDDDGDRKGPKDKKKNKDKEKDKKKDADADAEDGKAEVGGFFKAGAQVLGGQIFGELNPFAEAEDLGDIGGEDVGADGLADVAGEAGDPGIEQPDVSGADMAGDAAILAAAAEDAGDEEGPMSLQERFAVDHTAVLETAKEQGQEQIAERAQEGAADGADRGDGKARGEPGEEGEQKKGFGIGAFISGVATSVAQDTFIGGVVAEEHMEYVEGFQEKIDEQNAEAEAAAADKQKDGERGAGDEGEEESGGGRFAFVTKATTAVTSMIQDEFVGNVAAELVGEDNVDDFLGEVEGIQEETAGDEGDGDEGDTDVNAEGTKDAGADAKKDTSGSDQQQEGTRGMEKQKSTKRKFRFGFGGGDK